MADLRRRLEAIKKRLEEAGLTQENRQVIDSAPAYNRADALFSETSNAIAEHIRQLESRSSGVSGLEVEAWTDIEHFEEASAFRRALSSALDEINGKYAEIAEVLRRLELQRSELAARFAERLREFRLSHEAAMEQQANLRALIADSGRLTNELQSAEARERQTEKARRELSDAPTTLEKTRKDLTERLVEMSSVLMEAVTKVGNMSAGVLRANVRSEQVPRQYVDAIHEICDGVRIRELRLKCESLATDLAAQGPEAWDSFLAQIMSAYKRKVQTSESSRR